MPKDKRSFYARRKARRMRRVRHRVQQQERLAQMEQAENMDHVPEILQAVQTVDQDSARLLVALDQAVRTTRALLRHYIRFPFEDPDDDIRNLPNQPYDLPGAPDQAAGDISVPDQSDQDQNAEQPTQWERPELVEIARQFEIMMKAVAGFFSNINETRNNIMGNASLRRVSEPTRPQIRHQVKSLAQWPHLPTGQMTQATESEAAQQSEPQMAQPTELQIDEPIQVEMVQTSEPQRAQTTEPQRAQPTQSVVVQPIQAQPIQRQRAQPTQPLAAQPTQSQENQALQLALPSRPQSRLGYRPLLPDLPFIIPRNIRGRLYRHRIMNTNLTYPSWAFNDFEQDANSYFQSGQAEAYDQANQTCTHSQGTSQQAYGHQFGQGVLYYPYQPDSGTATRGYYHEPQNHSVRSNAGSYLETIYPEVPRPGTSHSGQND